ncbi:nitrate- and nitrite sensing domain-containing protein [Streptomyces sp. FXY-T5]|uniref:nitrate- and nitrite sensing domain-containing protein n=1 Tax=Streptomyces sp. FXY-T5 TaxID=3064901 RepID=UPI0027D2A20C|nr:nitrate- and nitrite sensing domain-containing protein [Streptomyces sp. FXY-T5]WMD04113.1 nitrate- and nitrite sensing domain-containing protein [Streptomyces sp. FXY-T5]
MQKTRPRRTGKQKAPVQGAEPTPPTGKGRPTHVRNRLIVAVAVVAAAIAGAGTPSVLAASGQLHDSQELVTLAEQTQDALALAHSLADERDDVTSYIAAGRPKSKAPSEQRSARVDRQVEELRADTDTPASLRSDLDGIAAVRRAALTGKSSALEAHQAYSTAITELHGLAEQLAQRTPPRAGEGGYALAELDSAVQQAAAARGLLLAALSVPRSTGTVIDPVTGLPTETSTSSDDDTRQRDALSAAAQQARLRSDAALADFRGTAPKPARASFDSTVTGTEVNSADKYLATLTDQPTLSRSDLTTSPKKLDTALSARVDLMRGVESALYDRRTKDLEALRDDDVTALEIRIAVLGALMLLAVGVATGMARSLTRPLAVLRLGSKRLAEADDPAAEEPVKFTGRNDEFAQAVRSVNALHAHAVALTERITTLESDRKHLVGQRQKMADAREELRGELAESAAQLDRLRTAIGGTFVNLALRTLGLVERQLAVIENLEEREQDPDRLATLFKLDHFATVMRRHSENLLVLAGTEHVQHAAGPVPLVDVVRAAVSEIERYERVRIAALPPHAHIAGFAADDLSHLLAELMENATSFSPPDLPVEISGWLLENGEVMLSVQDEGIGMTEERLERLNSRLADFDPEAPYDQEGEDGLGLGLYVVARLAQRHGVRVQLREQKQGGVAAVVVLPRTLLAAAPPVAAPASGPLAGTAPSYSFPGADAEANSNVLHGRVTGDDPLVALAEKAVAVRQDEAADATEADPGTPADPGATPADPAMSADPVADADPATSADGAAQTEPALPAATDALAARAEHVDTDAHAALRTHADPVGPAERPAPADPATPAGPSVPAATDASATAATHADPVGDADPATHADTGASAAPAAHADPVGPAERPAPADPATPAGPAAHAGPDAPADHATHAAPLESPAETTMELWIPAQPGGSDPAGSDVAGSGDGPHGSAVDGDVTRTGGPDTGEGDSREHERASDEEEDRVTDKGLPKRTPKITAPTTAPRQRSGSVDADALRRRLGGFRQGAQAGYRDVEAEIAERTASHQRPATGAAGPAESEEATGGTVEEASS